MKIHLIFFLGILVIQDTYTSWFPTWSSPKTDPIINNEPALHYSFEM